MRSAMFADRRPPTNRGFALVLTLLILALLVIVVVSYLSSMSAELQTSGAFTAKVRAAEAAQAAVDSATAMLTESFRDFPDSATVWDAQQTTNSGTPPSGYANIVTTASNEGTSLYLRAVPKTSGGTVVADPQYTGTAGAANDPNGNNPNNLACQTFVLPLISGVPNGAARLASSKASIWPSAMKLDQVEKPDGIDPINQNWTDLNVRRSASDIQGVIGSPPGWTGAPGQGPKPARAYWVNQTGSDGKLVGRYAYWIEDNSFRANVNPPGVLTSRGDNTKQYTDPVTGNPRGPLPSDLSLLGLFAAVDTNTATANASALLTTRNTYPGVFFPETHAFAHAALTPPGSMTTAAYDDLINYLSTNQSGALNLSRHGTQRVNLDAVVPAIASSADPNMVTPSATIQPRIDQIVRTIAFHLPNFGQRFYRTSSDSSATTLNDATQVAPKQPLAISDVLSPSASSHATIYLYKIATNIHDYMDPSAQPTIVLNGGTVAPQTLPTGPPDEGSPSTYWAQGKKVAPFIDEVAVRYRPITATSTASPNFNYPQNHFDFAIDYYVEVWNMSDRDVYASQQPKSTQLPHLNGARLAIRSQQGWTVYGGGTMVADPNFPNPGEPKMPPGQDPNSIQLLLDLTANTYAFASVGGQIKQLPLDGTSPVTTSDGRTLYPVGVVFPAGSVTVLTSDPSAFQVSGQRYPTDTRIATCPSAFPYLPSSLPFSSPNPKSLTTANMSATFYCANILSDPTFGRGQRHYSGKIQNPSGGIVSGGGVQFVIANGANYVCDISLENQFGYIDFARNSVVESGSSPYTNTAKQVNLSPPSYNDFSYTSSLIGNVTDSGPTPPFAPAPLVSELGDPRANNEQLLTSPYAGLSTGGGADQSRYYASNGTLGYINNSTVQPDGTGVSSGSAWPDYYTNGGRTPIGGTPGTYSSPGVDNAPSIIAGSALTSIGQLGDVYDPARIQGTGSSAGYSRGGGRTLKIGQHDDRYNATPPDYNAGATPPSVGEAPSLSNGWAAWRLTDIFSTTPITTNQPVEPIETPGKININGIARDNGAALRAALTGYAFQPNTKVGSDPLIHGDNHPAAGGYSPLATQNLNTDGSASQGGLPEIVSAVKKRLDPAAISSATGPVSYGPFFERGELGELVGDDGQYLFGAPSGASPYVTTSQNNTDLVSKVDMNKTFDRGREELFRRVSELICTRGDTFTIYAMGESLLQSPSSSTVAKVTGTHRMRVTFRLMPLRADGKPFNPSLSADGTQPLALDLSTADAINKRFARPDHYGIQVLETATY